VLARAIVHSPALLLLDEPFTALDRGGRAVLAEQLREERKRGAGILLSTHDVDGISQVADRAVLLENGVIIGETRREERSSALFRDEILALGHGKS